MPKSDQPARLPGGILNSPEVIDACRNWDIGRLFRYIQNLTDGEITASEITRRCRFASPSRASAYMNGDIKSPQRRSVIERVADGFLIPGSYFGIPAREWENAHLVVSATSRRSLELDLPALETLRADLHSTLSEGSVSEYTLDDWEHSAVQYGEATRDRAPAVLIADLAADLAALRMLLAETGTTSARLRLARVIAQLTGLMVLSLVKLDQRSAFRQWTKTARLAGFEAGDPAVHSWVLMQEAYGHYYTKDFREAISVARRSQEVVKRPCVGAALAAALEGRAHAALGRQEETRWALGVAEQLLAGLDPEELICSAFGYGEGSFRFHAGNAYTHLRDTAAAAAEHDRALQLIPGTDYTDRSMVVLDQAQCLIHDGDAGGAASQLIAALEPLDRAQRQGIIAARARDMMQAVPASERERPEFRDVAELVADT
jgi:hypothetical protein